MENMLKKIILAIVMVVLLSNIIIAFQPEDISVKRDIKEDFVNPNQEIEIELLINFDNEPSSLIVTEIIEPGWEIISSTPNANSFDGKVKWLLYGNNLYDGMKLKYKLKVPADFSEYHMLEGNWKTLTSNGFIEGDIVINQEIIVEKEINNNLLFIIIGVVLIILIIVILIFKKKK
jgi:hypothetical protein